MSTHELVANLRMMNRWRRGEDEDMPQPDPADVGRWLDAAADSLETVAQLRQRAEQAEARVKELESENARYVEAINKSESMAERGNLVGELHALRAANAELAGALREMVDAQDATVEQFTATEIDRLEKAMRVSREVLARHASGEPAQEACGGRCGDPLCNLSTEGELMREPAKHPDTERLAKLAALGNVAIWHGSYSTSHEDCALSGGEVVEIIRMDDDCGESFGDPIGAGRTLGAAIDAARNEAAS